MAVAELEEPMTDVDAIDIPKGFELIDGELTEMPEMGNVANWVAGELFAELHAWNRKARVGVAMAPETEYCCFPNRPGQVRKPDCSFMCCDPSEFVPIDGKYRVPPDLAIEVLSPTNTFGDIEDRLEDFFSAGTRIIWVIDPDRRYAMIHHADDSIRKIREAGSLSGEDVLPGFTLPLAAILPKKA
jgi:Uma2 family endonuclease